MSKYLDQIEIKLQSMKLSQDSYSSWLDNECTQRFLLEIAKNMQEAMEAYIPGSSIEGAGIAAIARNAEIMVLQNILEWKPQELEVNE